MPYARRRLCELLAVLASLLLVACEATIEEGLEERQANAILVALNQQGIAGSKEHDTGRQGEGFRVTVPPGEVPRALSILREEGLPRRIEPGLSEVFSEGALVPTPTEERARLTSALAGELSRSIEAIDGVVHARVHLAIPESRTVALDDVPSAPRASVLIKHRGRKPPYKPENICALVAGAVHQMSPDDVAVVGVPTAASTVRRGPRHAYLGPIAVTQDSAPLLKGTLAGALVLIAGLAAALVVVWRRR